MTKEAQLDAIDWKILTLLQANGRLLNVSLAERVGLSPAPCLRRVRALERAGVIGKYVALLNPAALNLNVTVFVQVKLDRQVAERFQILEDAIRGRPEVLECYVTTGDSDFLLRVVVQDVASYEQFRRDVLSRIESVASTISAFALKEVKHSTQLPLPELTAAAPKPSVQQPRRRRMARTKTQTPTLRSGRRQAEGPR